LRRNEYLTKAFSLNRKFIHFIFLLIAIGFAAHEGLLDCCSLNPSVEKTLMFTQGNDQSDAEGPIDFQDDGDETLDKDFFLETYPVQSILSCSNKAQKHLWAVANWKDHTITLHLPPPKG
jgi:hypothetical protein